uniref:Secreted protein n=1 Tax=Trichuris muris TaxID=70415 RepID=A0A5S6QHB3_TRIMR
MLLRCAFALSLCLSTIVAAEHVGMELRDDNAFVDQAAIRQREPTIMEVEFVEETDPPLERANGIEITDLTENIVNGAPQKESRPGAPLSPPARNHLPGTKQNIVPSTARYESRQKTEQRPFKQTYANTASVPSGYKVRTMANAYQMPGCAGPSVRTTFHLQQQRFRGSSGVSQVFPAYVAAPPSLPYAPQGAGYSVRCTPRRKRSPTFSSLWKSLEQ